MSLVLYGHSFSSYTQKVLIALYENGTPFEFRSLGPDAPQHSAEWLRRWPLRKFPMLVDGERTIVETSIIIEYLQLMHPGPVRLLPTDPMVALDVRFLDRFFDLHVMNAAQHAVDGALTGDPVKRQDGLALAVEKLDRAYAWFEAQLPGRAWAAGGAVYAGGLRRGTRTLLCGLDAPDRRGLSPAAWLPHAIAGAAVLRPRHRRGAALPVLLPPGGARSGLKPRRAFVALRAP